MQLIQDKFSLGLITGLVLPLFTFLGLLGLNELLIDKQWFGNDMFYWPGFRESTLVLMAICSNLLPSIKANRRYYDHYIRGIAMPTVLGSFAWLFYYDALGLFR